MLAKENNYIKGQRELIRSGVKGNRQPTPVLKHPRHKVRTGKGQAELVIAEDGKKNTERIFSVYMRVKEVMKKWSCCTERMRYRLVSPSVIHNYGILVDVCILPVCRGHEGSRNEELDVEMSRPSRPRLRGQQVHIMGIVVSVEQLTLKLAH